MRLAEPQGKDYALAWSVEEELTIATIQQVESVPRAEAIRRMQRRKQALKSVFDPYVNSTNPRLCRNPRCRRGDDKGPASLAHLRADAMYCNDACRMAATRSPKPQNRSALRFR
jgi:hypothetical protein